MLCQVSFQQDKLHDVRHTEQHAALNFLHSMDLKKQRRTLMLLLIVGTNFSDL